MAEAAGVTTGERRAETARTEPAPEPTLRKEAARPTAVPATKQPTLRGMDPPAHPAPTDADGEMLEIPAFLRRQAN